MQHCINFDTNVLTLWGEGSKVIKALGFDIYWNMLYFISLLTYMFLSFCLLHCFREMKCAILENCVPFMPYMVLYPDVDFFS